MSDRSNIDNAGAPQLAATNPASDVAGTGGLGTVPVAPGVGPEVGQLTNGGVIPDLTLLKLEDLLNLDPTDGSGPAGQSLQTDPLQVSPADGELPADLTSLDLDRLLDLDLSGADLPTLLEVAGLSGQIQAGEGAQNGPPAGIDPPENPLLDDENDENDEPGYEENFDLQASFNGNAPPVDALPPGLQAGDSPRNDGPADHGDNGPGNGPDSSNGQGNGPNVQVASNNHAGGNPDNAGGGGNNRGGGVNSNAGGNSGTNGGGAIGSAGSNSGNVGGGGTNSNAGGNTGSSTGAGAVAVAAAGITFPEGGNQPVSIAPAADPGQAVSPPAPATVLPAHSAATYVPSSESNVGPGNSSFGHDNGAAAGNNSSLGKPSQAGVSSPFDNPPSTVGTPDAGTSNAAAASNTGLTLTGSGASDSLVGGNYADDLSGRGGNDTLQGGAGDDTLSGGGGSDLLDGGAGADDLSGGGGADTLVWDFDDINIDGGGGSDILRVDSGDANIATFGGTIANIENVDLASDAGANTLTLSAQDVLDMSGTDTLTISGDALDSLDAGSGWTDGGVSGGNQIYTQVVGPDTATLIVDTDVAVNANILV